MSREGNRATMGGEPEFSNRPKVSPVDRFGREIDPAVLAAAEALAERLLRYAEQALHDPAVAMSLLEESAATVSRVFRSRQIERAEPIQNIEAYLFRAFIRRVNRVRHRHIRLVNEVENVSRPPRDTAAELERMVLVDEIMARCDAVTKDMFHRRVRGYSWREIAQVYGISAHAAEARFSAALKRVRKRLGLAE